MYNLRAIILIIFSLSSIIGISQPADLQEQPLDSVLAWMQRNYNDDSIDIHAIGLATLSRAADIDNPKLKGNLHEAISDWIGYTGLVHQDSLIHHDYQALAYYEELGDTKLVADMYSTLSIDLLNSQRLDDSQEATFKSIELYESLDDQGGIANAHRSLAYLHQSMGEPLMAIEYGEKAYDYYKSAEDYARMTYTLLSQMESYTTAGMLAEARSAGEECLKIVYDKVPEEVFVLGRAYSRLGDISIEEGELDQALAESRKAFEIVSKEVGDERASSYNQGIADVLRLQGKWQQAIDIYEVILKQMQKQGTEDYAVVHSGLYECYKNIGDYKTALSYHEKYAEVTISTNENTIENLKSEAVVKYETVQKDQELAVQQAVIQQKSRAQNITYGALAILLTLLGSLFYFYRQNKKVTAALNVKNEENQLLVKEIHHRVKNNLQILSSLLSLQSDAEDNEQVLGALQEGRNRVESMGMIHQRLYSQDTLSAINMKDYVRDLCDYLQDMVEQSEGQVTITSDVEVGLADIETAIPLGLIINELITNSIKYAYGKTENGTVRVRLWQDDQRLLCLQVSDDGAITGDNNKDTKSTNFGTQLVGILSKKLKGDIEVLTEQGYTTTIKFSRYELV